MHTTTECESVPCFLAGAVGSLIASRIERHMHSTFFLPCPALSQAKGIKNISTTQPPLCHQCIWLLLKRHISYTGFSHVGRDANIFYTFCLLCLMETFAFSVSQSILCRVSAMLWLLL
jgi:hypothetical protein